MAAPDAYQTILRKVLKKEEEVSRLLGGLSHPVRLRVLCYLLDEERCVNELTEICEISQSAMSQFLARMRCEGLVESRREGKKIFYRVADPRLKQLIKAIKNVYC